jgi:CubicO group peptidase (beta-lactamase class C family)
MTYSFSTAAGLMSSVSDLARYSNAIDEGRFLKPETWQKIFTPFKTPKGKTLQYGLGWFVKTYKGVRIVWHTGWWYGYSALFIKIPEKDLTFILLANSQDLSRPFYLTLYPVPLPNPFTRSLNSDLLVSDFARAFINQFAEL